MFGKGKNDEPQGAATSAAAGAGNTAQVAKAADAAKKNDNAHSVSSIGSDMKIFGKIACDGGVLEVFGRIEGEVRGTNVLVGGGAYVEGEIFAQDLTVDGVVKGVIHATRVKLKGSAEVEGDIFHRSLSMEENARFEGSSRREENPVEAPASVQEGPSLQPQDDKAPAAASEDAKVGGL